MDNRRAQHSGRRDRENGGVLRKRVHPGAHALQNVNEALAAVRRGARITEPKGQRISLLGLDVGERAAGPAAEIAIAQGGLRRRLKPQPFRRLNR